MTEFAGLVATVGHALYLDAAYLTTYPLRCALAVVLAASAAVIAEIAPTIRERD